jgi:hypothetical protein
MYLNPSDAPAIQVNPLGLGLAVACAAMLVAMFLGLGPLSKLAIEYAQIYRPSGAKPQTTAMVSQR